MPTSSSSRASWACSTVRAAPSRLNRRSRPCPATAGAAHHRCPPSGPVDCRPRPRLHPLQARPARAPASSSTASPATATRHCCATRWASASSASCGMTTHSHLPSRHLGLVQAEENQDLEQFLERAASAVAHETILDRILGIAAQPLGESVIRESLPPLGQTIAIARDRAFAFAYPHLLDSWRRGRGRTVLLFAAWPMKRPTRHADAVFLPGGYPELHAGRLAANATFLNGLRAASGLVYGECGGYMVLGDALIDADGHSHAMAGLLPAGHQLRHPQAASWLPPADSRCRARHGHVPLNGHEFHYSTLVQRRRTPTGSSTRQDAIGRSLAAHGPAPRQGHGLLCPCDLRGRMTPAPSC